MSLRFLATVNFATVLAGILMAWPVAGLRPMRAFRFTTLNFPSPARGISPPFFIVFSTMRVNASRKVLAARFSVAASLAISSIRSVRVILLTLYFLRNEPKWLRCAVFYHFPQCGSSLKEAPSEEKTPKAFEPIATGPVGIARERTGHRRRSLDRDPARV